MAQVLVGRDEHVKSSGFGSGEQVAVLARDGRVPLNVAVDAVSIVFNWPAALTARAATP